MHYTKYRENMVKSNCKALRYLADCKRISFCKRIFVAHKAHSYSGNSAKRELDV